jgi:toxoflavin synthase
MKSFDPRSNQKNEVAYDAIAASYTENAQERSDRTCVLAPSAKHYLGKLGGQSVFDLACGSGYFTRLIKHWGAAEVTGVDISDEMVSLARKMEGQTPLGVLYLTGDVCSMARIREVDKIFAAFLLHYSSSVEELRSMCRAVAVNLKSGGTFTTFCENPFKPVHEGIKYDVAVAIEGPIRDGAKVTRTHYDNGMPRFSFEHYHYEAPTYESALQQAGFEQIEWLPFVLAQGAEAGFPNGYWDEYIDKFSITCLRARKAK